MILKWLFIALIVLFMVKRVGPLVEKGDAVGAFAGVPLVGVCGLALAMLWRHSLSALVARPFNSLYDGGNLPPEPRPLYSIAQTRQKQGKFLEAVAEIRKQLNRFPTDFEGRMFLAQIQAEDLGALPAAEITIQRVCSRSGHSPKNIIFAMCSLTDCHLAIS